MMLALFSAAGPIVSRLRQAFELRGSGNQVFTDLQRARLAAVAENRRYRWSVVDAQTFEVARYDTAADLWEEVRSTSIALDTMGIDLSGVNSIVFAPDGRAATAGRVTLTAAVGQVAVNVGSSGSVAIQ
jgi:hypothetical protein